MFNHYFFFSIIIIFISVILLFDSKTSHFLKMPPKPRLNVQNFPRPPLLERTPRHLEVKWHGQTIADTKDAYWVLETYHAPSMIFQSNYSRISNKFQHIIYQSPPSSYPSPQPRSQRFVNGKDGQHITPSR